MERSKVTWRDHITDFEEPHRSQIVHNIELFDGGQRLDEDVMETFFKEPTLPDILDTAFAWADSPQGYVYWAKFSDKLNKEDGK